MAKPWEPLEYQLRAVELLLERSYAGLLLKPGMRKTSIKLAAFSELQRQGFISAGLVIAPLRVIYTSWPNEVKKWEDFNHLSVGILHGKHKAEVLNEKHDLYLINPEGTPWLFDEALLRRKKWPFDDLTVDESTKYKHTNTQRFKLLRPHLKKFKRRTIMTGSPTARHLLDLFGQCFVMDRGESLGPYITKFREEYFFEAGYDWKPKKGSREAIYDRLAPRCYYAHDEDWLKLPQLLEKDIPVTLPPKAQAMYDELEATTRLALSQGKVTAANVGVVTMKLRQVANGGVYLDGSEKKWQHIHEAKTEAVCDVLEELSGEATLITYDFIHDLERLKRGIKKVTGKEPPHIGRGGVSPAKLPQLIAEWSRGEVTEILVQPQSASLGIDGLQTAGRAVVWASLTYNAEDYDQLIRRLRRSGQSERVLVANIIAQNTVDEAVIASVRRKDQDQNTFFMALKEYWSGN